MMPKIFSLRSQSLTLGLALTTALSLPVISQAQVVLTANDALGSSSFNAAGTWSPAGAPSAGNTYSTVGYLLRSPATAGNYTFAGDSLTVGGGNGGGANPFSPSTANNNALIFKASGVNLTVNNLILDGGQIRDGNGNGNVTSLNGNLTITANGGAFVAQDTNIINSAISGSGPMYIGNNGNGSAQRLIMLTSATSTFNGNIVMEGGGNGVAYSQLNFAPGSIMNFLLGASGVNNGISGVGTLSLNGGFAFNLAGAATTLGATWDIVDPGVATTYGATFSINGFTQNGSVWDGTANGVNYEYNTLTGGLSVTPEPSIWAMFGTGAIGLMALVRRKK